MRSFIFNNNERNKDLLPHYTFFNPTFTLKKFLMIFRGKINLPEIVSD